MYRRTIVSGLSIAAIEQFANCSDANALASCFHRKPRKLIDRLVRVLARELAKLTDDFRAAAGFPATSFLEWSSSHAVCPLFSASGARARTHFARVDRSAQIILSMALAELVATLGSIFSRHARF